MYKLFSDLNEIMKRIFEDFTEAILQAMHSEKKKSVLLKTFEFSLRQSYCLGI